MDRFLDEANSLGPVEDQLRESLRHVPAPEGFTDRVMARIAEREARTRKQTVRSSFSTVRPYAAWWAGIAAALLLAVGGGDVVHVRHQRQAREAAVQAQMDMAMQLTNHALNEVELGLDRSPAAKFAQLWNGTEK